MAPAPGQPDMTSSQHQAPYVPVQHHTLPKSVFVARKKERKEAAELTPFVSHGQGTGQRNCDRIYNLRVYKNTEAVPRLLHDCELLFIPTNGEDEDGDFDGSQSLHRSSVSLA